MVYVLMNVGLTIYGIDILVTAWLVVLLFGRQRYKVLPMSGMEVVARRYAVHPHFTAYTVARLAQCLILFPLFVFSSLNTYSKAYWRTSPLVLFFQVLVLIEFLPRGTEIKWVGLKARLPIHGILRSTAAAVAVLQLFNRSQSIEDFSGILVAMVAGWVYVLDPNNLLAMGLVVALVFPVISTTVQTMNYGQLLRYVPTISFGIAQVIWLRYLWRPRSRPA